MNQSHNYVAGNIGLASALNAQSNEKQRECAAQIPAPDTVRSLTDRAHQAIEILEHELGRLADFTYAVREPMPCDPSGDSGNQQPSGPEVISLLRALLSRIDSQTRTVRQIAAELRI